MIHAPVGRRTVGKTTLADFLVSSCTYQVRFSPRITLPARGYQFHNSYLGWTSENEGGPFAMLHTTLEKRECVTVVPDENVDEEFSRLMALVRQWYQQHEHEMIAKQETLGVLVDEARFEAVKKSRDLDWLFRCTQRDLVHVYLTVHRPKDLNPDIRAIVDYWYVFHITQPADIEVIEDECLPVVSALAQKLQPREFVMFDVGTQKSRHWTASESHRWKPKAEPVKRATALTATDSFLAKGDEEGEFKLL